MSFDLDPDSESQLINEYDSAARRVQSYSAFASPRLADVTGSLALSFPQANPGVLLSVSEAVSNGQMSFDDGVRTLADTVTAELSDEERYDNVGGVRGLLGKLYGGVKSASRWTFASANFPAQAVTNVGARITGLGEDSGLGFGRSTVGLIDPLTGARQMYNRLRGEEKDYAAPETSLWDGFVVSTDLGAMLTGRDPGQGWFIGETAYEYQQQQVARYRGGYLNDQGDVLPYTFGRDYAASQGMTPQDKLWNFLSGAVDFGVAVKLPLIPGSKIVGSARAGQYGERAANLADKLPLLRTYAGLTNGTSRAIVKERVPQFLDSRYGQSLINSLVNDTQTVEDVLRAFDGNVGINTARLIAEADDPQKMRAVLERVLGLTGQSPDLVGITSIDQLPKAPFLSRFVGSPTITKLNSRRNAWLNDFVEKESLAARGTKTVREKLDAARTGSRRLRLKSLPNHELRLDFSDPFESANSVRDFSAYMDLLRYSDESVIKVRQLGQKLEDGEEVVEQLTRRQIMDEVTDFALAPDEGKLDRVQTLLFSSARQGLVEASERRTFGLRSRVKQVSPEAIDDAAHTLIRYGSKQSDLLFGQGPFEPLNAPIPVTIPAEDLARGLMDEINPNGITPPLYEAIETVGDEVSTVHIGSPRYTAFLTSEMRRTELIIPNLVELQRATSRFAFLFEKGSIWGNTSIGDPNSLVSMLDAGTNFFKKGVTKSGAYILRNLAEAKMMLTLAPGLKTGPRHPLEWIATITGKKNLSGLSRSWDDEFATVNMGLMQREAREAMNDGFRDINPVNKMRFGLSRRAWAAQTFPELGDTAGINRYAQGLLDEVHLANEEPLVRLVMNGVPWDDGGLGNVWNRLDEVGNESLRILQRQGMEPGEAFDLPRSIKAYLTETEEGRKLARRHQQKWTNVQDPTRPGVIQTFKYIDDNGDLIDDVWLSYIEELRYKVTRNIGDDPVLTQALLGSPDGMPKLRLPRRYKGNEVVKDADGNTVYNMVRARTKSGAIRRDANGDPIMVRGKPKTRKRGEIVRDADDNIVYDFKPVYKGMEYDAGVPVDYFSYSDEAVDYARKLVRQALNDPELRARMPKQVKYRVDTLEESKKAGNRLSEWWDAHNNAWYGQVFGAKDYKLFRAPAWKAFYWQIVDEVVGELSPEDARHILNRLKYEQFTSVRDYADALRNSATRVRGGVTQYRVPTDGFSGFVSKVVKGGWMDETEYLDALRAADEAVEALPRGWFNEYGFAEMQRRVGSARKLKGAKGSDELEGFDFDWAAKYLGDENRLRKLIDQANADPDGVYSVTAEQAHYAAGMFATEQTKRLLYDASTSGNFVQLNRNLIPFGAAQVDVISRYGREVLAESARFRNVGNTLGQVQNADPSDQGKGFFYRDPNTDELMFNFPYDELFGPLLWTAGGYFGGQTARSFAPNFLGGKGYGLAGAAGAAAAAAVTGLATTDERIKPSFSGTVKSLSMGFDVKPGFGPVVQFPASYILSNKPQYRDILDAVAPYGVEANPLVAPLPAWAKKLAAAIQANERLNSQFGDVQAETLRALMASGEYDLSDPVSKQQLEEDARSYGRSMMALYALAQFTGPIRPKLDFEIPVAFEGVIDSETVKGLEVEGSIKSNQLAAVYRSFQEEDFENATTRMIETFGPDIILYLAPSTKTNEGVKGLGVSRAFGDWEMNNQEFSTRYPDVFGYFSPVGTDFDYQTYLRQINTGQRNRVVNRRELISDAEAVVGRALYRQFRREQGETTTTLQDEFAKQYREKLYREFPGFANAPLNIADRDATINKLIEAAYDPLVDNSEAAIGMRLYLDARERAVSRAQARRREAGGTTALSDPLNGSANSDLRFQLRIYGERLAARYPQFKRVWVRELFDELEGL